MRMIVASDSDKETVEWRFDVTFSGHARLEKNGKFFKFTFQIVPLVHFFIRILVIKAEF